MKRSPIGILAPPLVFFFNEEVSFSNGRLILHHRHCGISCIGKLDPPKVRLERLFCIIAVHTNSHVSYARDDNLQNMYYNNNIALINVLL